MEEWKIREEEKEKEREGKRNKKKQTRSMFAYPPSLK